MPGPLIYPYDLSALIAYVIEAHDQKAREQRKRFRKWDGATPYAIHPIWCAMTLLTETRLRKGIRKQGARALLLHDILEDTTAPLPEARLTYGVGDLVQEMTFDSFEEEVELVFTRSELCILLKLYDKVSNLLDMNWRTDKHEEYVVYTRELCANVEATWYCSYSTSKKYPDAQGKDLNIVKLARAICS